MSDLYSIFPFIRQTEAVLVNQSKFLHKVILTGKINALDVASTLFEVTEKTSEGFNTIKDELIEILLRENLNKLKNELQSKAQVAIDILIRNLFERTADVGFLATDEMIIDFLKHGEIDPEIVRNHLIEYTKKYSVYNEIVIFDPQGGVKAHMNEANRIETSSDPIITRALHAPEYVEQYGRTDIFPSQEKTLVYAQKIETDGEVLGVLCLCFRFEDEMERIFANLTAGKEQIMLFDNQGLLVGNDPKNMHRWKELRMKLGCDYDVDMNHLLVYAKTKGYQGYMGQEWYAVAAHPALDDRRLALPELSYDDSSSIKKPDNALLNAPLRKIIEDAEDIVGNLGDIIINGELIASKEQVYVLRPVLENLRLISASLLNIITETVFNLEAVVEAIKYDARFSAELAIDIMDRNLYERANDCRWWALTPTFKNELAGGSPDKERLGEILAYINDLYTVYTNLFLYDTDGKIVASSKDRSIIGTKVGGPHIRSTLNNMNSQHYFVSEFEPKAFYGNKPTYVYHASVVQDGATVGGIGIVFDSTVEFQAMLQDSLPHGRKGCALYTDREKTIIASTSRLYRPLDRIDLPERFFSLPCGESLSDFIEFEGKRYVVGACASSGYREYKVSDNYENDVIALTLLEVS